MLAIRLQRIGKTKHPTYRLVVNEKAQDTRGSYLEAVGTFNPHVKENGFLPLTERLKYWLSQGAVPSATVHNLLLKAGLVQGKPAKSVYLSTKRKAKLAEKKKAAVPAAPAAVPVPVAPVESSAAPVAETPAA